MTVYSYAQLEGLWISAGGSKSLAPIMAAIAEAESGGNSDAHNPSGASGLWQILGNPFPGNPFDPATNARMAVAKYKSQGLGAWTTYTSGAYKAYLSSKTTPDSNVPGSPSAATAQAALAGSSDCLVPNPAASAPLVGSFLGPSCLFTKSNARAFLGAWMVTASGLVGLAAVAVLAVGIGMKASGPIGSAAEGVGGALMLVPGAEGIGAGVKAAGSGAKAVGKGQGAKVAAKRQSKGAKEDADLEKMVGQPRENPDLEVGGGTVRESASDTAARQRRQAAAARSKARRQDDSWLARYARGDRPATREEAGF